MCVCQQGLNPRSNTEKHPQNPPPRPLKIFFDTGSCRVASLASNLWCSCLSLPGSEGYRRAPLCLPIGGFSMHTNSILPVQQLHGYSLVMSNAQRERTLDSPQTPAPHSERKPRLYTCIKAIKKPANLSQGWGSANPTTVQLSELKPLDNQIRVGCRQKSGPFSSLRIWLQGNHSWVPFNNNSSTYYSGKGEVPLWVCQILERRAFNKSWSYAKRGTNGSKVIFMSLLSFMNWKIKWCH